MGWMSSWFYQVSEWIMRIAYINLLWILFTTLGLFLFGFMPASVAMFTILRKWLMQETDIPIFKTFYQTFKKEFIKANKIWLPFTIVAYLLYSNYLFLGTVTGVIHTFFTIGLYICILVFLVTLLFIIPVYVHYELKFFQYFRTAFLMAIIHPFTTIFIVIGLGLLIQLFLKIPGLIPLFSIGAVGFVIMFFSFHAFKRLENKRKIVTA